MPDSTRHSVVRQHFGMGFTKPAPQKRGWGTADFPSRGELMWPPPSLSRRHAGPRYARCGNTAEATLVRRRPSRESSAPCDIAPNPVGQVTHARDCHSGVERVGLGTIRILRRASRVDPKSGICLSELRMQETCPAAKPVPGRSVIGARTSVPTESGNRRPMAWVGRTPSEPTPDAAGRDSRPGAGFG